ncbi:squalene--hopene cyclase [Rossellomorea sp. BNER]|uniref:squalene--hopene cyclase n=1 Tax=Rossellomorea sp. BNER TaxID=2962031 RepID=UPI003AF2B00D|nr:squalene--hopene cyclase [Rossellomorea sp. BNER]
MKTLIEAEIRRMTKELIRKQNEEGKWGFCFENSLSTDANMIILLKSLKIKEDKLINQIAKRILSKQEKSGAWKLFYDEDRGNVSLTVECYFALLYSGVVNASDANIKKAQQFIFNSGGLLQTHSLTKFMLAINGQYQWDDFFPMPIELLLIPRQFPISFWDFSSYARVHLVSMFILKNTKFVITRNSTPDLKKLLMESSKNERTVESRETRIFLELLEKGITLIHEYPQYIQQKATVKAEQYILQRIEGDGTLYSYVTSTFFMIYSLLALGYAKNHPIIIKAIQGLKSHQYKLKIGVHIQNSPSDIWDTALISYALQVAGIETQSSTIVRSSSYLLKQQHSKIGDWALTSKETLPGGWGFSESNTIHPDVDDTTASLRAISRMVDHSSSFRQAWDRGVNWTISLQNSDGGWPAFERGKSNTLLTLVPMDGAEDSAIDPSTADLTGRTLEFLGSYTQLSNENKILKKGIQWILNNQERNGSWYGRWGISYIYGTWAALTGLKAVGVKSSHDSLIKAENWLISIQNRDGGWGESCKSDTLKRYTDLGSSTPSQTAWAVDALIALNDEPTEPINKGILNLINSLHKSDWTTVYPTGAGLPNNFYIHYHSYNWIWPLLTLCHYKNKFL